MEAETIAMQYTDEGFAKGLGQETTLVRAALPLNCLNWERLQADGSSVGITEAEELSNVTTHPS